MANVRRFPVHGHAAAVIEMYAEECPDWESDSDIAPVIRAFRAGGPYLTAEDPRRLVVAKADALAVSDGLCELANGESDMADANARTNFEMAAYNRAGWRGLSTLRKRVLEWSAA